MFTEELLREFFDLKVKKFVYDIKGTDICVYYNLKEEKKPLLEYITFIYNKLKTK